MFTANIHRLDNTRRSEVKGGDFSTPRFIGEPMDEKLSNIRKLLLQAVIALEDMDQRMLKMEADILSINRWIEKNDTSNT